MEAFRNPLLESLGDGAVLTLPGGERLAMSTDSFVVQPRRFPGGSIGELAVHGTCNDLAMTGAVPSLDRGGIRSGGGLCDRGTEGDRRRHGRRRRQGRCADRHRRHQGGPKGAADGLFVTTTGAGVIPAGRTLSPRVGAHRRQGALVGFDGRSRHGGHARPGRPGHRGRHPFRHRACQPAGGTADGGRPVHPLAAGRDPGRGRDRLQRTGPGLRPRGACSTRNDFRCGPW